MIKAAQMALNRLFALSLYPMVIYGIGQTKRKTIKVLKHGAKNEKYISYGKVTALDAAK